MFPLGIPQQGTHHNECFHKGLQWRIQVALPAHHPLPNGTQFFCFHIHFCRKVPVSEVSAPQWISAPQQEILDPQLVYTPTGNSPGQTISINTC